MRMRAVATIPLITAALLGPLAAPAAAATLTVIPDRAVAPATLTVSGSCDPISPGATLFPKVTTLTLDGAQLPAAPIPVAPDGTFTGSAPLPPGPAPGAHALANDCGGQATITVLAAPTLVVSPASVRAPARVSATGTCPSGSGARTELFLAGDSVGSAAVDPVTGEFGPFVFLVPEGRSPGRLPVTSSCGGSAPLGLLAPVVTTPPTTVPAAATQAPTTAATATRHASGSLLGVLVLAGVALLLLAAVLAALLRARRLRHERRWLEGRVRVDATTAGWHPSGTSARAAGPAVEVELLVRRGPPVVRTEEVAGRD